jgi:hypothetical protein
MGMAVPLFFGWIAMAQSKYPRTIATFPGYCLKWINVAEAEIHRKNLNLDDYIVLVVEREHTVTVGFSSKDSPEDSKGSGGSHPDYEVEIRKSDSKIMRSNFVR